MGIYFKLNFKSIFITFRKDGILNLSLENKKGRIDESIILVVVVVVLVKIGKETNNALFQEKLCCSRI